MIRKTEAEEARRKRALAKEKAREEATLRVDVGDDDANSDAAPVSPVRTAPDDESDMSEEEEEDDEDEDEEQSAKASPNDARVGANLR